eukprot:Platyproteum_vivax@DN5809_c0_g2_i3.p1
MRDTEKQIMESSQSSEDSYALYNPLGYFRKYRLKDFCPTDRELGEGSFGTVTEVRHCETQRDYAMKCIEKSNIRETEIHYTVSGHPNIVSLIEYFPTPYGSGYSLVLDECSGSLQKEIRSHKFHYLPEFKARRYLRETVAGLCHLQRHGIIHRDIKPKNLMLLRGHIRICDFGLSCYGEGDTAELRRFVGTENYMAPEIWLQRTQTYAVDVWSLGIVLFEMLTGRICFEGLIDRILYAYPRQPREIVSPSCWHLVLWMLEKEPQDRPTLPVIFLQLSVVSHHLF